MFLGLSDSLAFFFDKCPAVNQRKALGLRVAVHILIASRLKDSILSKLNRGAQRTGQNIKERSTFKKTRLRVFLRFCLRFRNSPSLQYQKESLEFMRKKYASETAESMQA